MPPFTWLTILADLGILSSPPCMDSRALVIALSSRCDAKETRATTVRASTHSPSTEAPITANEVRTWNPKIPFCILAIASWNILAPARITPKNPRKSGIELGSPIVSDAMIANSMGRVITADMSFH